jgi:NADPH:quinone reductase-like Zn-dependent oxidoreductase
MRAVWHDRQGAADHVLVCGELPTPEAGHGEVRVRLEASGVNPSDTYRRRGPPAMDFHLNHQCNGCVNGSYLHNPLPPFNADSADGCYRRD